MKAVQIVQFTSILTNKIIRFNGVEILGIYHEIMDASITVQYIKH